jgi:hypothetical protein
MIEGEQFDALVESVRQHGLMEPVWLTPDGTLLDGRNRMAACKAAGMLYPEYFVSVGSRYCVCMDSSGVMLYVRVHRSKPVEWSWTPQLLSPRLKSAARRVLGEHFAARV